MLNRGSIPDPFLDAQPIMDAHLWLVCITTFKQNAVLTNRDGFENRIANREKVRNRITPTAKRSRIGFLSVSPTEIVGGDF